MDYEDPPYDILAEIRKRVVSKMTDQTFEIDLFDFEASEGETFRKDGSQIPQEPYRATVIAQPGALTIDVFIGNDGPLTVNLEIIAGQLFVHAYDPTIAEPVNLIMSNEGTVIDTHDRDLATARTLR